MLRRKLLLILSVVTALLLGLAVAALWSMRAVHGQLQELSTQEVILNEQSHLLGTTISEIELELYALQIDRHRYLDALIDAVERMRALADALSDPETNHLSQRAAQFERHIAALAVTRDPDWMQFHQQRSVVAARDLREDAMAISTQMHEQMRARLTVLTQRFRSLVIGIALGFMLVINGSLLLLLRSMEMILQPVDQLVTASRQLAAEQFDYRVDLPGRDEFHELAAAFNQLGEQLRNNEQRKIETMHQAARTLNHELNNAMAIIELQLRLLRRRSAAHGDGADDGSLAKIHASLVRMAEVVDSLKHIRQIVLTDYTDGVKMLDLARSVDPADAPMASSGDDVKG